MKTTLPSGPKVRVTSGPNRTRLGALVASDGPWLDGRHGPIVQIGDVRYEIPNGHFEVAR